MSTKLSQLIMEAIELPVHDLGYKKQVPHGELSSFVSEEEEEMEKKDHLEEEEEKEEEELEEDLSVADHQKRLPVHNLGYHDEIPDEELLALIGGEEEREEADLDLGSDQILPNPSVNEEEEEKEDEMHKLAEEEEEKEEDEEDFEDSVNEALRLLSKKSNKKAKFIKEEEEGEEEEKEEEDEKEEMSESDMPGDKVYHKGGKEEGPEKREIDEEGYGEKDEIEEGLNAIFEGKALSKSFKDKTATIFEAAVKSKVAKERNKIREAYKVASLAHRKIQEDRLVGKLSDYLDYAVNEWTKQNKVAIESSIKTQITEDFMEGLKSLFESKYIDVPQNKKNVLEALAKKVEKLETQLNEQTKSNVELHKNLKKAKKDLIIHKACEGLTDSNKERLVSLTENFQFTTAKEFAEKVLTIRKSFFEKTNSSSKSTNNRMTKSGIDIKENFDGNYEVDAYIDAFRKRNL